MKPEIQQSYQDILDFNGETISRGEFEYIETRVWAIKVQQAGR
jgi:hypothetical protein